MGPIERARNAAPEENNVGGTERLVRATLGPTLAVAGVATLAGVLALASGPVGVALGALLVVAGLRMTQTAITQKCYLNERLGRNSYCPASVTDGGGRQSAASDSPASTRR